MTPARLRIPKAAIPALLLLALTIRVQAQYVLDSIDVGGRFVGSMCYSPRENVVYGLSNTDNFVFAIDCSSNQVVARVDAYYPRWVTYDSADGKLYCTFGLADESLLVVDGSTHQPVKRMSLPNAALMAWDPTANWLFVSCTDGSEVVVIDCAGDTVIKHIQTSAGPLRMHLNNRHRKLYVQCHDSERLNIVDLNALEVIENFRVPGCPEAGCYSEAADKYYCGAGVDVVVVDGATDTVVGQIGLTDGVRSMVAVDRHSLVMGGGSHSSHDSVYVIDAAKDSVVRTIPGVSVPYGLYWSATSDLVYCASAGRDQVAVIAGNGSRMLCHLPVGDRPFCFAAAPRHRRLYVGHLNCSRVYVIRDEVGIAESGRYSGRPACSGATFISAGYELKGGERARLVDVAGRPVAELVPGVNDVRHLPPGVYAVVGRDGRHHGKVVKVR